MNEIDIIQNPSFLTPPVTVKRTVTSTGARITTQIKAEDSEDSEEAKPLIGWEPKSEVNVLVSEHMRSDCPNGSGKEEVKTSNKMSVGESLKATNTNAVSEEDCLRTQIKEEQPKEPEVVRVKEEPDGVEDKRLVRENVRSDCPDGFVKDEVKASWRMSFEEFLKVTNTKVMSEEECLRTQINEDQPKEPEVVSTKQEPDGVEGKSLVRENMRSNCPDGLVKNEVGSNFSSKPHNVKKEIDEDRRISSGLVEDGDFPEESDWFLVGRTIVTALSTTKGRKLVDNEIVDFTFPSQHWRHGAQWIVRFSTKRFGEVYLIYVFILYVVYALSFPLFGEI